MAKRVLTIGHSPDPDDAFMFYALTHDRIDTGGYRFEHLMEDIQSLNERAMRGELAISAVSLHAYAYLTDRYALLSCGISMGKGYGPILVRRAEGQGGKGEREKGRLIPHPSLIAVPGTLTTAFLTLKLYLKDFDYVVAPFDRIMETVQQGKADAGLLIHEGQLTYRDHGLEKMVDLGEWWLEETGLPLPLGVNVVRRDLGEATLRAVSRLLKESVDYALTHREEALAYAMRYGRGLDAQRADAFVGMYVNDYTRDLGEEGRAAVTALLRRAYAEGVLSTEPQIEVW